MVKDNTQLIKKLETHVYNLSHLIGDRSVFNYEGLKKAEEYIVQAFTSYGYDVEFELYSAQNKIVKNIIAYKKGMDKTKEIIIVGAHYDTCFNPGADDNASGVAVLLELANELAGTEAGNNIKFIAFVNEEPPFFKSDEMGSLVYAKNAKIRGEKIKAVLVLESIGYYSSKPHSQSYPPFIGFFYPDKANFICIVGNFPSRWLVKKVVKSFKKQTNFPLQSFVGPSIISDVDFSDNWSFWQEGFPAVMVTDTAFYRCPHYHKTTDTYEKLDYQAMAEVTEGLRESLEGLR